MPFCACIIRAFFRGVAQSGSALRSGRRGRRFKSCLPDHLLFLFDFYRALCPIFYARILLGNKKQEICDVWLPRDVQELGVFDMPSFVLFSAKGSPLRFENSLQPTAQGYRLLPYGGSS